MRILEAKCSPFSSLRKACPQLARNSSAPFAFFRSVSQALMMELFFSFVFIFNFQLILKGQAIFELFCWEFWGRKLIILQNEHKKHPAKT